MQKIWQEAEALQTELVERRRDLHRHPETGWTEFRTASIVIKELQALGYEVYMGDDALVEEEMMCWNRLWYVLSVKVPMQT